MNLLLKTCLCAVAAINLMVSVLSRDALATEHEETPSSTTSYHAYALLIGSNRSGPNQQPLRFAHSDAQSVAAVLQQIGGYPANNVETLADPTVDTILERLDRFGKRIAQHARAEEQSTLFFYYSGHARAQSLTLGDEELRLDEIRHALESIAADVKIVVLDACQTGAYSRIKGASLEADFSVNSIAMLQTSGTAVMASSSADELSQESDDIGGSFFTHHLVVGLRGAADSDDDGRISLFEAYDYAYNRTLIATAGTAVGAQHVTLETDLKGKGAMILSWPEKSQAKLQLPEALEARVTIYDTDSQTVQAEVTKASGSAVTLAFPAGNYAAILNTATAQSRCTMTLREESTTLLDPSECVPFDTPVTTVKAEASTAAAAPKAQVTITRETKPVLNEKKKRFVWSPFLEVSIGMMFNKEDDSFHRSLEDVHYSVYSGYGNQFHWSVIAGVSILRYIGVAFFYSSLDRYSHDGEAYDVYSGDQLKKSISWSAFRLGGQLRGSYPLFNDWVTPFVTYGMGAAHVSEEVSYEYDSFDFNDGQYETMGWSTGESHSSTWNLSFSGGLGVNVKVYRILHLVTQGEYIYAPGLASEGNTHNHGGWVISAGVNCSL